MWVAVSGSSEPPAFTHTKNALFSDLPIFPASQIKKKSQSRKTSQIKKIKSKKKMKEKLNSKSNFYDTAISIPPTPLPACPSALNTNTHSQYMNEKKERKRKWNCFPKMSTDSTHPHLPISTISVPGAYTPFPTRAPTATQMAIRMVTLGTRSHPAIPTTP